MENNKLRVLVMTQDDGLIGMERSIGFTPSKGLILCEPIYGTVGTVVYEDGAFTATMDHVMEPTDGSTLEFLLADGWAEYKL